MMLYDGGASAVAEKELVLWHFDSVEELGMQFDFAQEDRLPRVPLKKRLMFCRQMIQLCRTCNLISLGSAGFSEFP